MEEQECKIFKVTNTEFFTAFIEKRVILDDIYFIIVNKDHSLTAIVGDTYDVFANYHNHEQRGEIIDDLNYVSDAVKYDLKNTMKITEIRIKEKLCQL